MKCATFLLQAFGLLMLMTDCAAKGCLSDYPKSAILYHKEQRHADSGCPETVCCCEQEEHQAGSVADTPYAQVPPLPPWMADLGAGGAAAQLPGSSAAAAPAASPLLGMGPLPADILDRESETRRRVLELLDQAEESNANFVASRQRAERVHAETQAQLARFRAAMQSGQAPANADLLNQAAAATEAQLARHRAVYDGERSRVANAVSQAHAATEAQLARLQAAHGGQHPVDADLVNRATPTAAENLARLRAARHGQRPIGADALNQALGEAPCAPALPPLTSSLN